MRFSDIMACHFMRRNRGLFEKELDANLAYAVLLVCSVAQIFYSLFNLG